MASSIEKQKYRLVQSEKDYEIRYYPSAMSFVFPSKYDEQSLPRPNDSRVKLEKSQAEYVAVLKFGGYANDEKIARYSEKLGKALEKKGISYTGNFRFLGYNAYTGRIEQLSPVINEQYIPNWK